jgi:TatD DNase family protein
LKERGVDIESLVSALTGEGFRFVLDIGTKPGDFAERVSVVTDAVTTRSVPDFIHFSAGLWPDARVIENRAESIRALERDVASMLDLAKTRAASGAAPFAALGECGLDRYWNGPSAPGSIAARANGAASSADDGPGTEDLAGEEELFGLQLAMAKGHDLPVIVHSRDAFDATLGVIKDAGWDRGVIHCFSYGIAEARAFIDRGWHISFPGNVTWPKKEADIERIRSLVRYVPRDRLLLETDAPYLAPAPHRGKTNTPLLVRHVYERVADCLSIGQDALSEIVFANARELFALSESR